MRTSRGFFNKWEIEVPELHRILLAVEGADPTARNNSPYGGTLNSLILGTERGRLWAVSIGGQRGGRWWRVESCQLAAFVPWTQFRAGDIKRLRKRLSHRSRDITMEFDGNRLAAAWTGTKGRLSTCFDCCEGKWGHKRFHDFHRITDWPLSPEGDLIPNSRYRTDLQVATSGIQWCGHEAKTLRLSFHLSKHERWVNRQRHIEKRWRPEIKDDVRCPVKLVGDNDSILYIEPEYVHVIM